jgi:hypothetical protein
LMPSWAHRMGQPQRAAPISTDAVENLVGKSGTGEKNMRCDSGLTRFEQFFVQSP